MSDDHRILFICTGNYYRSRFAEAVFNHLAEKRDLPWRAFSRGLMAHLAPGPIASETRNALMARGIRMRHTAPGSVQLTEADMQDSAVIIALKDSEHRPMFANQFPDWTEKVVYWDVSDLPHIPADVALPAIEEEVRHLIDLLVNDDDDPQAAAEATPHAEPASE